MKVGPVPLKRAVISKQPKGRGRTLSELFSEAASKTCQVGSRKSVQWDELSERQKKWIFIGLCCEMFLGQLGFAIFAPFFPEEAGRKDVSTSMLGWIFGVFQVVVVVFTPVTMKLLPVFGPTNLLLAANFLTGLSNIAFGYSWYVDAGTHFISMCFITRIIGGIGVSMQMMLGYGLLPYLYEESLSTASSIVETVLGVAFIFAPVIGSALYLLAGGADGQGYVLPFVVLGTVQCIFGVVMLACFPQLPIESEATASIFSFSPRVIVPVVICTVSSAAIEFTGPTLQPFLAVPPFNFGIAKVGTVYAVNSIVYTIFGPLIGILDDRSEGAWANLIMLVGIFFTGAGYVLVGPADWVQEYVPIGLNEFNMWAGMCLVGAFAAFGLVPTFGSILGCATDSDKTAASNSTSALYNVVYGLGAFLGPTLGGALGDAFGAASSYSMCGLFCMVISTAILLTLFLCAGGVKNKVEVEDEFLEKIAEHEEPLLSS